MPNDWPAATTLQIGTSPPWGLFESTPDEQRAQLAAIADAGIDHLFLADHVSFRGGAGADGLVQLAALSGIEPRLGLYLGVFLLALRHPMVAARQIVTLASAAPGRLTVGVGVGGEDRHEFEVCGVDPRSRGRRTDASLDILTRLLDGATVDHADEFFTIEGGRIRPTPTPPVRITIGGRSDRALERAARFGSGWLAAWCSARRLAEGIQKVETMATEQGRTPDWQHGIQLWVGVGSDPADGRKHVAEGMAKFYKMPFEPFERYTPCGRAEDIAAALLPYVEAGASVLNLAAVGPDRQSEVATLAEVKRLLVSHVR